MPRDRKAIEFLEKFRMATAKQIAKVAYDDNIKICYNRLNRLHDDKLIYKTENKIGKGYLYSANRIRTIKQFMHDNIRNEFYLKLLDVSLVQDVMVEKVCGSIRPDIIATTFHEGTPYFFLVEVETNANHSSVNYDKYHKFFLNEYGDYFITNDDIKPIVVYITDKNIDSTKIRFNHRHIKTDLSNFMDIFY